MIFQKEKVYMSVTYFLFLFKLVKFYKLLNIGVVYIHINFSQKWCHIWPLTLLKNIFPISKSIQ